MPTRCKLLARAAHAAGAGVEVVYHVGAAMKGGANDFEAGTIWGTRNEKRRGLANKLLIPSRN